MSLIPWAFGLLASLLAPYKSVWICASLAPRRRPNILFASGSPGTFIGISQEAGITPLDAPPATVPHRGTHRLTREI
ncbi:MAG: hypothetical protein EXS30_07225 [Pedosphaera sp.]|nr:hypothetical protein [Pedosphaera sp.]